MPNMNGQDLAEKIKMTFGDLPIILITGYRKPGMLVDFFDFVLEKPFPGECLIRAVKISLLQSQIRIPR